MLGIAFSAGKILRVLEASRLKTAFIDDDGTKILTNSGRVTLPAIKYAPWAFVEATIATSVGSLGERDNSAMCLHVSYPQ